MRNNTLFRILGALLLVVILAGVAIFAYNAGLAQGVAAAPATSSANPGTAPYPYYYGGPFFFRPFGFPFFGFPFLGCLFPLLFFFLIFFALRFLFWRGPRFWGGYGGGRHGSQTPPPYFEEWHRQAHEPKPEQEPESGPESDG